MKLEVLQRKRIRKKEQKDLFIYRDKNIQSKLDYIYLLIFEGEKRAWVDI